MSRSRRSSTNAVYRTQAGRPKPIGTGKAPKSPRERMNKTEQAFATRLDAQLAAGDITAYWFEAITWRLADNTFYRPDFLVQFPDGALVIYECKGTRGREYMTTPDAWVKLKVCAETMPFPLVVVWKTKDGHWHSEALN